MKATKRRLCPGTGRPRDPHGDLGFIFDDWFGTCPHCGARVGLAGEATLPYRDANLIVLPHIEKGVVSA